MTIVSDDLIKKQPFFERLKKTTPMSDIVIGIILATFFINLLVLVFPIGLLLVYDRVIPHANLNTLILLVIGVFIAMGFETILRLARSYVTAWSDARFEHLATLQAFQHILKSQIQTYEVSGAGIYLEQINAVHALKNFFGGQALTIMIDIPFVIVYLAFIFYIAGPLVLIPVVMLFFFGWATYTSSQSLSKELEGKYDADDRRVNYIITVLTGIHTIKSMAIENPMIRRYERLQDASIQSTYKVSLLGALASIIAGLATQMTIVLIIAVGAIAVLNNHLTIGGLAACIILAGRTLQPIGRAIDVWTRLQAIKLAEERLSRVAEVPLERTEEMPDFPRIKGEIEFKNIYFRYKEPEKQKELESPHEIKELKEFKESNFQEARDSKITKESNESNVKEESEDNDWLLKNINLHVMPGEMIGLRGENFTGKSSLLMVVMGILRPQKGTVFIDGEDIFKYNTESLRKQIAYLPQRGVLFNGTILENLTMFRPELAEKAKEIAEGFGLGADIRKLPRGYDTVIGKYAVEALAPGVRQRICIARALMDDPKIILFDDANSFVDVYSDNILKSVLLKTKGKITSIVVSLRPSILSMADRVYEMGENELKEVSKEVKATEIIDKKDLRESKEEPKE